MMAHGSTHSMSRGFMAVLAVVATLSGCSTYVEDRASAEFQPVYPEEMIDVGRGASTGAIYKGSEAGLFARDGRASRVGDIVTVYFTEAFAATKSQTASSTKDDSFSLDLPDVLSGGFTDSRLDSGTTQSFAGTGDAEQSNSLTGQMSVTVMRVFPNGTMEILGQKKITLNNGDEYIRLRGLVRPEDISSENLILSDRIANADITYIGAGDVADSSKRGWLGKAMTAISPF